MEIIRTLPTSKIILGVWAAFSLYLLTHAWVSEDAFITLRVVDNFLNGYGLRWNVTERVQVYTHPLWLLLHIPIAVFIPNVLVVSALLCFIASVSALYLVLRTAQNRLACACILLFLPLLASKCFVEYSSAGLETPLFYLLYAGFGYVVLHYYYHPRFWLYVSFASALLLFNRLDCVLFIAPTLTWLVVSRWRNVDILQILIGAIPLIAWHFFALFYYGFFFPNTKYAKLDSELSPLLYFKEGWHYAGHFLSNDTASALILLLHPIAIYFAVWRNPNPKHPLTLLPLMMSFGTVLYSLYIINIGGDYMMGRFWAMPFFSAVWLIYIFSPARIPRYIYLVIILLLVSTNSVTVSTLRKEFPDLGVHPWRMIDAVRSFGGNRIFTKLWPPELNFQANHKFVGWGKKVAQIPPPHAEIGHYIGMVGFFAGPHNVIVDEGALTDALLSHLPATPKRPFYIGHFYRPIPKGYLEFHQTGSMKGMAPSLQSYFKPLRLITSGDLWDVKRLKTIVEFNLGAYDHHKNTFLHCNVWE